jgi:vacuolar-type H+-ATPase subunit D/Vma8
MDSKVLQEKQEALMQQKFELIEEHSALLHEFREQSKSIYDRIESLGKEIYALDKVINDACAREEALSH